MHEILLLQQLGVREPFPVAFSAGGLIIIKAILWQGIQKGLSLSWELVIKVVLPVFVIVSFLKYTPVINWLSAFMQPLMQLVGLPGEASLPIVLAAFVNVYAGIAAVPALGFDVKELTIIGAIILIAHDLPLEAAISKKSGSTAFSLVIIRIIAAFLMAALINIIM